MFKTCTDRFASFARRRLLCFGFRGFENYESFTAHQCVDVRNFSCVFPIKHVDLFRAFDIFMTQASLYSTRIAVLHVGFGFLVS